MINSPYRRPAVVPEKHFKRGKIDKFLRQKKIKFLTWWNGKIRHYDCDLCGSKTKYGYRANISTYDRGPGDDCSHIFWLIENPFYCEKCIFHQKQLNNLKKY